MSTFTPSVIPPVPTTINLYLTATQFKSFATPAITVVFPSAYDQTQINFAYTATATYAATRIPSTIGGQPATAGVATAIAAGATQYGQVSTPDSRGGGGSTATRSGLPTWAIGTIVGAGVAGLAIFGLGLFCWCRRKKTLDKKQAARKNRGNARIAAAFAEKHADSALADDHKANGDVLGRKISAGRKGGKNANGVRASYYGVPGVIPPTSPPPHQQRRGQQNVDLDEQPSQLYAARPGQNPPRGASARGNPRGLDEPYPPTAVDGGNGYNSNNLPPPIAFETRQPDSPQRGPHVQAYNQHDAYGTLLPPMAHSNELRRPRSYSSSLADVSGRSGMGGYSAFGDSPGGQDSPARLLGDMSNSSSMGMISNRSSTTDSLTALAAGNTSYPRADQKLILDDDEMVGGGAVGMARGGGSGDNNGRQQLGEPRTRPLSYTAEPATSRQAIVTTPQGGREPSRVGMMGPGGGRLRPSPVDDAVADHRRGQRFDQPRPYDSRTSGEEDRQQQYGMQQQRPAYRTSHSADNVDRRRSAQPPVNRHSVNNPQYSSPVHVTPEQRRSHSSRELGHAGARNSGYDNTFNHMLQSTPPTAQQQQQQQRHSTHSQTRAEPRQLLFDEDEGDVSRHLSPDRRRPRGARVQPGTPRTPGTPGGADEVDGYYEM